jgi:hypothetical protein
MINTIPTVPSRIHKGRPISPITSSESGRTFGARPTASYICRVTPGCNGNCSTISGIIRAMSSFACERVTPGLSRATPRGPKPGSATVVARFSPNGRTTWGSVSSNLNDAGRTPTISYGVASMVSG